MNRKPTQPAVIQQASKAAAELQAQQPVPMLQLIVIVMNTGQVVIRNDQNIDWLTAACMCTDGTQFCHNQMQAAIMQAQQQGKVLAATANGVDLTREPPAIVKP